MWRYKALLEMAYCRIAAILTSILYSLITQYCYNGVLVDIYVAIFQSLCERESPCAKDEVCIPDHEDDARHFCKCIGW